MWISSAISGKHALPVFISTLLGYYGMRCEHINIVVEKIQKYRIYVRYSRKVMKNYLCHWIDLFYLREIPVKFK